jgi:hypothetical protein
MTQLAINIICFYAGMAIGFLVLGIIRSAPRDDDA